MTRRLLLLTCLACAPALASAQITVAESTDRDSIINIAECSSGQDQLTFQWTVASTSGIVTLYASDTAGCPPSTSTVNGVTTTAHTGVIASNVTTSNATGIPAGKVLNAAQITCTGGSSAVFVCVFDSSSTTTALASTSVQLDLVAPAAPNALSVSPGDGSLNVSWQQGSGSADGGTPGSANSYRVYYAPADGSSGEKFSTFTGSGTTSGRITGLTNGAAYNVSVSALTLGGNESLRSNALAGTPISVQDFWRLYQADGGREQGGCASGAAGLAALVALAPLALRRKRRRP